VIFLLLFIFSIDQRYHTFEEIAYKLDSIANYYPAITHLDTIGYSTCDSMPIFAMKISDNVNIEEDEPAILYVACHHAEEILGVEICMYMINDLTGKYNIDSAITYWIDNREIWIVPLLNPEGHKIVMDEIDTTWRKNKRDNNNNGIFDLDYDGVDLNRNYDFYWSQGGSPEPTSEYYRGSSPFSENETRAIRDLVFSQHFVFCNTYHSARTGLGEVIYFPWRWSGGYSPDFPFILQVADSMSKRIIKDNGSGHYLIMPGYGLDGKTRNWLYGVHGTFTYCVEVSTTTIQPGWMVDDICQRNLVGAYYLLKRVSQSGITGCIYDSLSGEPLSAEVIIDEYYDPALPPRQSEPILGRFLRIVSDGIYDVEIHKYGYASKYYKNIEVADGKLTELNVRLSKMEYEVTKKDNDNRILINPNPASNPVVISLNNPLNFSSLKIYDIIGRLVINFDNLTSNIIWYCNDKFNRKVPGGVYCVIGETNEKKLIKKILVLGNSY